jgi:membrane-bound serine protease (ClpP class)
MLIRTDQEWAVEKISWGVIITAVCVTSLFFLFIVGLGIKAQRAKPSTGIEGMIGEIGQSISELNPDGTVRMHGEIWQATSLAGIIQPGQPVKVIAIQNLTLQVEPIKESFT